MIHLLYIVYCIARLAYTGHAVISSERAFAFVLLMFIEFFLELILVLSVIDSDT